MTDRLGERVQLVGGDIFVTDAAAATAALLKMNQVGTATKTLAAEAARRCGFAAMVSHRSGETPELFIADPVVEPRCGLPSGIPPHAW